MKAGLTIGVNIGEKENDDSRDTMGQWHSGRDGGGGGGWGFNLSSQLICENNRKSHKIIYCVDFFSGSSQDMGIFYVFQLSFDGGGGFNRPITDR